MRSATLDDIARAVGVSTKTVSRVVNSDARVSRRTRQLVTDAINQLGYIPNLAARSLATARSGLIGLFIPPGSSHFFSELVRSAMRACRAHGYNLALEEFDGKQIRAVDSYRQGIRQLRCDGIILPPVVGDDIALLDLLERDGVRYVRISPAVELHRSVSINSDHAQGAAAIANHFWSNGHRRFGLIAGMPQVASGRIRRDAFVDALCAKGVRREAIAIAELEKLMGKRESQGLSLIDLGRLGGGELLCAEGRPTAIFTFNDELAAGVVAQAHALGIAVPYDLSVAGFDDSDAARLCWPPLTTVRQPISEIAAQAVEILAKPPTKNDAINCPVNLVIRKSSGPAQTDAG